MDYLLRCLPRDDCAIMINYLLSIPQTAVLAIGSRSCMHFMHHALPQKALRQRLYYLPQTLEGYAGNSHLLCVQEAAEHAKNSGAQAVILYLCCADVLVNTDYKRLYNTLTQRLGIPVFPLQRGFVATRRVSTIEVLLDILQALRNRNAG